MSKFIEFIITQHKRILVEVLDSSTHSIDLATDLAEESVDGDIADNEMTNIFDTKPAYRYDDVILIEDYLEEEE